MALVHISLVNVSARAGSNSAPLPIPDSVPAASDTMQSGANSAQSTIVVTDPRTPKARFWSVTTKGDIWVQFGANPTAVAEEGHLVLAGTTRFFAVSAANEKIAIKDAA